MDASREVLFGLILLSASFGSMETPHENAHWTLFKVNVFYLNFSVGFLL